jgi:predicted TIM-barrel fold metal-dependent hydrolase
VFIVDSQVHVWGHPTETDPWHPAAGDYVAKAQTLSSGDREPMGGAELLSEMDAAGVNRAILVPPVFAGDENLAALAAARDNPDRFRVMGRIALERPDESRPRMERWLDEPGMVGFRLTFHWDRQQTWLDDGTASWFWPEAESLGAPVAVYAPGQLDRIAEIAATHPGLPLLVDHFGLPLTARDEEINGVVDELVKLAQLANVAVKASALPSYVSGSYPFTALHDPIRRVVAAFGAERVFWGSEMTRLACPYVEAVRAFTDELDFLSPEELRLIMGTGLCRWIGWEVPTASM